MKIFSKPKNYHAHILSITQSIPYKCISNTFAGVRLHSAASDITSFANKFTYTRTHRHTRPHACRPNNSRLINNRAADWSSETTSLTPRVVTPLLLLLLFTTLLLLLFPFLCSLFSHKFA